MKTRGRKRFRPLSFVLSLVLLLTMVQLPSMTVRAEDGVGAFVNRCYQVTLGREADPSGYADWTNQLTSGQSDGAFVAFGFVFSPEYTNANKDNAAFVTDMYTLFLGRTPDEAGFRDWVGQLDAGADRQTIFAGFANSTEFFNICTSYGITAGVHNPNYDRAQVNNVNMFVARMYKVCFNRLGDQGGQADWVNRLLTGQLSGIDCANGFINSSEYKNLNLSNSDYVKNMYRAFMGREYDEGGYQDWMGKLAAGYTRDEVFAGFANSQEFQEICNRYGINRGSYTPTDVHQNNAEIIIRDENYIAGNFRVVKETQDNGGSSRVFTYNGATKDPKTITSYNSSGVKNKLEEFTYDNSGYRTQYVETYFNSKGNPYSVEATNYAKVKTTSNGYTERGTMKKNGKNIVTEESTYQKYNGKYLPVEKKAYYNSGSLESVTKATYDQYGRPLTETAYDAKGNLEEEMTTTYGNYGPTQMVAKYYDEDGKVEDKIVETFSYNAQGVPTGSEGYVNDKHFVSIRYELDKYNNPVKVTVNYLDPKNPGTQTTSYVLEAF